MCHDVVRERARAVGIHVIQQPGYPRPFASRVVYLQYFWLRRMQLHYSAARLNCVKQPLVVRELEDFAVHRAATGVDAAIHARAVRSHSGVVWQRHAMVSDWPEWVSQGTACMRR